MTRGTQQIIHTSTVHTVRKVLFVSHSLKTIRTSDRRQMNDMINEWMAERIETPIRAGVGEWVFGLTDTCGNYFVAMSIQVCQTLQPWRAANDRKACERRLSKHFFTQLLPLVFLDYQRNRINSVTTKQYTVFSSHFSYNCRPNIAIIRLLKGKRLIYIYIYIYTRGLEL